VDRGATPSGPSPAVVFHGRGRVRRDGVLQAFPAVHLVLSELAPLASCRSPGRNGAVTGDCEWWWNRIGQFWGRSIHITRQPLPCLSKQHPCEKPVRCADGAGNPVQVDARPTDREV
jgi:hypothetical protein